MKSSDPSDERHYEQVASAAHPYPRAMRAHSTWSAGADAAQEIRQRVVKGARTTWNAPAMLRLRHTTLWLRRARWSGAAVIVFGAALTTLLIIALDRLTYLPNRGVIYLPVVAFIAYYWDWWHGAIAALLDLFCIYLFFVSPFGSFKPLTSTSLAQLFTDAASIAFILAIVQLAASRRAMVEREASRFASLASVGLALAGELNEERLLRLIASTACDLTGAGFAAFTLRPIDMSGRPLTPSRGDLFQLAAVVGVTPEQEALFRRMPLGGEGLLAPIFRYGKTVRVADAAATLYGSPPNDSVATSSFAERRDATRSLARAYSHGAASSSDLRGMGLPRGHPTVRSFLGAPLLDHEGEVRGGLLLGHIEPDRFTAEDERLLQGLAAQAATALENARLYRSAQSQAHELDVIFESIADGVRLVDAEGQTIRENGAAKNLREALDADDEALPDAAGDEARSSVLSVRTKTGEPRAYAVTVTPVRDEALSISDATESDATDGALQPVSAAGYEAKTPGGDGAGSVIVWHDVTEAQQLIVERRARIEADARRALLQMVVDELPSGVYLAYGPDARLALVNRAAIDAWGAQWEVGQPMVEFLQRHGIQVLRPDSQPMPLQELATLRAVRTGEPVSYHQEIIVRPDGTELPVLFNAAMISSDGLYGIEPNASPLNSNGGGIVVVVLEDMTQLKAAERLKDEFIAMAAHELRTPMAAVKGYAQMLQRSATAEQGAPLAEWQREALDSIDLATTRLVDLTNDLLDVSRLQAHRMELRLEPHDMVALIRRVARRFQVTTQTHHIIIESQQDYIVATIDAPRMEQIVGNLLSNAIKYSPGGGDIVVTITADVDAKVARVSVRDSGIGIPAEQQATLFARFARAENARELGIGGTGLGLYLCRELLAQMDGRIWFESEEGKGTTIYFEVPLHTANDE